MSEVVVAGVVVGLVVVDGVTAAAPFVVAPATEPEEVPTMPEPALAIGAVAVGVPIGMSARASAAASSRASGMQSVTV